MSVLEKKALAFEKLAALKTEKEIDEILLHLENLQETKNKFETDEFFKKASDTYDDVLQKLAQ